MSLEQAYEQKCRQCDRLAAENKRMREALEKLERENGDCLYVLDALWDKDLNKLVTQKWAEILIRNKKRVTGASSVEDSCQQSTE